MFEIEDLFKSSDLRRSEMDVIGLFFKLSQQYGSAEATNDYKLRNKKEY